MKETRLLDIYLFLHQQKHCWSCKHFKSVFNRYNTFDFGICLKLGVHDPLKHYREKCKGQYYQTVESQIKK